MNVGVELFVEFEEKLSPKAGKQGSCCSGGIVEVKESKRSLKLRNNLHNAIRGLNVSFECVNMKKARWPEGSRRDVMRAETALKQWILKVKEFPAVVIREDRSCLSYLFKKKHFVVLYGNPPPSTEKLRKRIKDFNVE